jgi:hypothetical protein
MLDVVLLSTGTMSFQRSGIQGNQRQAATRLSDAKRKKRAESFLLNTEPRKTAFEAAGRD